MIYVYDELLFFDEDELNEYIASENNYWTEEGLMNIIENEVELIETYDELIKFCESIATTLEELCDEYKLNLIEKL